MFQSFKILVHKKYMTYSSCYIALHRCSYFIITLFMYMVSMETYCMENYSIKTLNHRSNIKCWYYITTSNKCNHTRNCRK